MKSSKCDTTPAQSVRYIDRYFNLVYDISKEQKWLVFKVWKFNIKWCILIKFDDNVNKLTDVKNCKY
jgi:hypothetical protein